MNRRESATSAKKCLALLHEEQCLEWRIKGLSYRKIGEKVGMTQEGVSKALKRALEKHKESCAEKVEDHRIIEIERLEKLLKEWMPKALGDDSNEPNARAANVVLKTMKRKAELLGLDAQAGQLNINPGGDVDTINVIFVKPNETKGG